METQTEQAPKTRFWYLKGEMEGIRAVRLSAIQAGVVDADPECDSLLQILNQLLDSARYAETHFPA